MLTATADRQGTVEVRKKDELVATLQTTGRFQMAGKDYFIARHTITKPKLTLHHDDTILAEAEQTFLLSNIYDVRYDGKTCTMKLEGYLHHEAVLYSVSARMGSLASKSIFNPTSRIDIDLPSEIALETQVFVLWIFLQILRQPAVKADWHRD